MTKIKVGVIGAGVVSEGHLEALKKIPKAEIAGIADPNEEARLRQSRKFGIKRTEADYKRLLDDKEIDLVYLCVPHYLHCKIGVEALEAGKHVVCEKPLAMNAKEAEKMLKASHNAKKRLFIAENHRFIPENIKIRELIKKEEIGKAFMCLSCFIGDEMKRMNDPHNWKGTKEKSGGGVIIDNGFHMIDTLMSFFGEIENVLAFSQRLVVQAENKEEDTAIMSFTFKGGVLADLGLTFAAQHNYFPAGYIGAGVRYDIYGTEGSIHLINGNPFPINVVKGRKIERWTSDELAHRYPTNMNSHFIDCLINNKEPLVTAEDGIRVMQVIDACYESVKTGKRILI